MVGLRTKVTILGTGALLLLGVIASCGGNVESPTDSTGLSTAAPSLPAISEVVFSGDLKGIETVPGRGDSISAVTAGTVKAVRLSSKGKGRQPLGDGDSGIVRLTPMLSDTLSGRRVTVSITLRSAPENGSSMVKVLYSRPGATTTSGWRDFTVGKEFAASSFEYDVPAQPGGHGPDLVSIWADPDGRDRAVEVSSIEIKSGTP